MFRKIVFIIFSLIWLPEFLYGHSGRLDSQGGHHDRRTGTYHFHRPSKEKPKEQPQERLPSETKEIKDTTQPDEGVKEEIKVINVSAVVTQIERIVARLEKLMVQMEMRRDLPLKEEVEEPIFAVRELNYDIINRSNIRAYQNDFRREPSLTLDNDRETFWHSDNMELGAIKWLAYQFPGETLISALQVIDDYTNKYAMGELKILISDDSTNGADGNWKLIKEIPGDVVLDNGDGVIEFTDPIITKWLKLEMRYKGRAAHGGTPAFYLSEIIFYGETD